MAKYLWRDDYLIGHPEIDAQHQHLFALLDKLFTAVCSGTGAQVVEEVIDELVAYTRHHFVVEESLMRELNYPALEKHRQDHQQLLEAVNSKMTKLRRGEKVMSIDLLEFMNDWLCRHILSGDMQFKELL